MSLSKHYIDTQTQSFPYSSEELAAVLKEELPEVVFAYVLGSSTGGTVAAHADLDLAVYLEADEKAGSGLLDVYSKAQSVVERVVGPVRCDMGVLNRAEPIYRFEALKGQLLFSRDEERRSSFFSLTCREYEHQLFDYQRQRNYRRAAQEAAQKRHKKR
jgi:predicted nucleotidyltransferase